MSNTYKEGKAVDYSKFFERFYRIEESHNNREHKGFGIGLSMAQSMVKLFKGRIFGTQTEEPNFRYNAALAQDIENKWQKIWDEQGTFWAILTGVLWFMAYQTVHNI